jgi:hypothetical protein
MLLPPFPTLLLIVGRYLKISQTTHLQQFPFIRSRGRIKFMWFRQVGNFQRGFHHLPALRSKWESKVALSGRYVRWSTKFFVREISRNIYFVSRNIYFVSRNITKFREISLSSLFRISRNKKIPISQPPYRYVT